MEKYLDINTDGWKEIACDKCGSVTCFAPDHPEDKQVCLACAPMMSLEEWQKAPEEK